MAADSGTPTQTPARPQNAVQKTARWVWPGGGPGGAAKEKLEKPVDYGAWRDNEVIYPLITGPLIIFIALWFIPLGPSPNPKWTQALISVAGSGDLLIFAAFLAINLASKYRTMEDKRQMSDSVLDGEIRASGIQWRGVVLLICYTAARISVEQANLPNPNFARFMVATASFVILLVTMLWANKLVLKFHLDEAARRLDQSLRAAQYVQR